MRKWKPYGNQRDPNAWLDVSGAFPTETGSYRSAAAFSARGTAAAGPATPGTTINAWCGLKVDGTAVGYVGTTTKLYEITTLSSGTFTDRSKGGGYAATFAAGGWCFTQFGNISIAVDYIDSTQSRDATTTNAFADLAGTPPKAKIALTQSNCVLLFGYNDGVNAYADGWWASDVGDHTTWTPAASNDAANGRILSRPGPVTAAVAFRDEVIVFKADSVHRMRYVGAPFYWSVELLADGIGASYKGGVCNCGDFLIFSGPAGPYMFDGAQVRFIGDGFDYLGGNLLGYLGSPAQAGNFYPSQNIVTLGNTGLLYVYNAASDSWGYLGSPSLAAGGSAGTSYINLIGAPSARAAIGGGYNLAGGNANYYGIVLIDLAANPCAICDDSANSNNVGVVLKSSFFGDERGMTNVTRIYPQWGWSSSGNTQSLSAAANAYRVRLNSGAIVMPGALSSSAYSASSTGQHRFDVNQSVRFFQAEFSFAYDFEIDDFIVVSKSAGTD